MVASSTDGLLFIVTASSEFTAHDLTLLFSCHHHSQSHLSFFHRHNPHTPGKHSCTTDHNSHFLNAKCTTTACMKAPGSLGHQNCCNDFCGITQMYSLKKL
jgi:hypothetical protein